jgi:hypothetical protein
VKALPCGVRVAVLSRLAGRVELDQHHHNFGLTPHVTEPGDASPTAIIELAKSNHPARPFSFIWREYATDVTTGNVGAYPVVAKMNVNRMFPCQNVIKRGIEDGPVVSALWLTSAAHPAARPPPR